MEPIVVGTRAGGLSVATTTRDYIAVTDSTAPLHRQHIVLHEIAHLLLGHNGVPRPQLSGAVTDVAAPSPAPSPAWTEGEETQAEALATTIAEFAVPASRRLPAGVTWVGRARRDLGCAVVARRLYRRLHPLWRVLLADARVGVTFEGVPELSDQPLPVVGAFRALYRRVIEIYDGLRLVGPAMDPAVVDNGLRLAVAAGLPPHEADAVGIAAGLHGLIRSEQDIHGPPPTGLQGQYPPNLDLLDHARVLATIADAYVRWPLISDGSPRARRAWPRRTARRLAHRTSPASPSGIDPAIASAARMYDFYLGGDHSFPADRSAAEEAISRMPLIPDIAKANRAFLDRAVRYLAGQGVRQFLDIGSGIPTMGNVHQIAQAVASDARVLYVDHDPVAVLESKQMLAGNDQADAIEADLRAADDLLRRIATDPRLANVINLDEPVAVILAAVLHFVPDDSAYHALRVLTGRLVPGSWLAISHGAVEGFQAGQAADVQHVYQHTRTPGGLRTSEQILRFFDGFDLVEPGLVWLPEWGEGKPEGVFATDPSRCGMLAAVARKTAHGPVSR